MLIISITDIARILRVLRSPKKFTYTVYTGTRSYLLVSLENQLLYSIEINIGVDMVSPITTNYEIAFSNELANAILSLKVKELSQLLSINIDGIATLSPEEYLVDVTVVDYGQLELDDTIIYESKISSKLLLANILKSNEYIQVKDKLVLNTDSLVALAFRERITNDIYISKFDEIALSLNKILPTVTVEGVGNNCLIVKFLIKGSGYNKIFTVFIPFQAADPTTLNTIFSTAKEAVKADHLFDLRKFRCGYSLDIEETQKTNDDLIFLDSHHKLDKRTYLAIRDVVQMSTLVNKSYVLNDCVVMFLRLKADVNKDVHILAFKTWLKNNSLDVGTCDIIDK